jgi:DNA modification methylase
MGINICHGDAWEFIGRQRDKKFHAIITDPPYDSPLNIGELLRVCSGNIILFCKPENQYDIQRFVTEYAFWIKTPSTKNFQKKLGRFVEMILIIRQGDTFNQLHWSQMTGVYDDRLIYPPIHPYEKPFSLIERLVRIYTKTGDLVLDPFCGSGTVPLVCKSLGRSCLGIEKEKEYFELAEARIESENGR